MSQSKKTFKALSDTTLRRLRNTPSYFFLIWRWSMWFYALILIVGSRGIYTQTAAYRISTILLVVTLLQTLIVTLYAPVIQHLLPRLTSLSLLQRLTRQNWHTGDEDTGVLAPLANTKSTYWNIAIYSLDVIICGLITYLTGPFGLAPSFGSSSPFYRYGMSTAFAAAFAYRYRGALAAAIGYDLFVLLGVFFPPSLPPSGIPYVPNVIDFAGSLVDTPVAALSAAFIITLLANLTQSKRQLQADLRQQRALLDVGETIVREASEKQRLLQKSAEQLCKGGPFQRLVIALVSNTGDEENDKMPETDTLIYMEETKITLPVMNNTVLEQVVRTGKKLLLFEPFESSLDSAYKLSQIYLPFFKEGQVYMILGAEGVRRHPFDSKQENFLTIAGTQLLIALDNIRLTEQTIQLAATAERGRIARELHDGVAQLVYMLSLNAETSATQAHRIAEASDEDAELLVPLAERLDKLVTISKQALWETRNYMFSLKPLMSGTTTLTQMLTNQLREFETISDLPVHLTIEGTEAQFSGDRRRISRRAKVGAAIFRIVQEALTNAYKHAEATEIRLHLHYLPDAIEVEICDNGRGMHNNGEDGRNGERQRIYSGHGIEGMRERTEELEGTLEISQGTSGGVNITVRIPL